MIARSSDSRPVVVLVSANAEWRAVRQRYPEVAPGTTPFGEWCAVELPVAGAPESVPFLHGGWGKIAAAASTQYAIDRWTPRLLVNLGTCGGFAGHVERGEVVLAERTLVYDIVERMGDADEAIAWYATSLDLAWLGADPPHPVRRGLLVSADADLDPAAVAELHQRFGAIAGDWESGAIAHVAARNGVPCLILRGVSDLVGADGGEAYDVGIHVFEQGALDVMTRLIEHLPAWLTGARP